MFQFRLTGGQSLQLRAKGDPDLDMMSCHCRATHTHSDGDNGDTPFTSHALWDVGRNPRRQEGHAHATESEPGRNDFVTLINIITRWR